MLIYISCGDSIDETPAISVAPNKTPAISVAPNNTPAISVAPNKTIRQVKGWSYDITCLINVIFRQC